MPISYLPLRIIATGWVLPEGRVSSTELDRAADLLAGSVQGTLGIEYRHYAADDESASPGKAGGLMRERLEGANTREPPKAAKCCAPSPSPGYGGLGGEARALQHRMRCTPTLGSSDLGHRSWLEHHG
jgi:hypothetical protein